jgi:hypothetical protein
LLPLECAALTKTGNVCQISGAATQSGASKLARHNEQHLRPGGHLFAQGIHHVSKPETFTQAHIPLTVEGVQLNIATLHPDVAADRRFSGERPSPMSPARDAQHRCELFFSSGPCNASFKELI